MYLSLLVKQCITNKLHDRMKIFSIPGSCLGRWKLRREVLGGLFGKDLLLEEKRGNRDQE